MATLLLAFSMLFTALIVSAMTDPSPVTLRIRSTRRCGGDRKRRRATVALVRVALS